MSQIITIESNPVSSSGNCYVTAGTPVTYTVVSGISAGIYVSYEWYLNGTLVGIGTGYTLTNPQMGDEVYLKILNCTGGVHIGDWIDDITFYYNDVSAGVPQTYYIDLKASFDYDVISAVLNSDATINSVEIQINNVPIVWTGSATSIDITPIITETSAISANSVLEDDLVTLVTQGTDSGTPTIIRGKLKVRRVSS